MGLGRAIKNAKRKVRSLISKRRAKQPDFKAGAKQVKKNFFTFGLPIKPKK